MSTRRILLVAGLTAVGAHAGVTTVDQHGARGEVLAALDESRRAWNRGDLVAFCADYADDAVFIAPSGVTRGRAKVLARYQAKYGAAPTTMGELTFDVIDVRATAAQVTVALRWSLTWPPSDGGSRPPASGHSVVVSQRIGGRWLIVHDASM